MTSDDAVLDLNEEIINAIKNDDKYLVISLIESADFNVDNKFRNHMICNFLNIACRENSVQLVKYFLDHDFDLKNESFNPLITAISYAPKDYVVVIKLLLDDPRIDINKKNYNTHRVTHGISPLVNAIHHNRCDIVALLLENDAIDVNCFDIHFKTPFYYAATTGHHDIAKLLLDDPRVDPNAYYGNRTVLQELLAGHTSGGLSLITVMLSHPRVDSHMLTKDGKTPMELILGDYKEVANHYLNI